MTKQDKNKTKLGKKKIHLSAFRKYHWVKGGAEIKIEDLKEAISYTDSISILSLWNHYHPDENLDSIKAFSLKRESLLSMKQEINKIKNNIISNAYMVETSTDSDDLYYMEIIESIDSVAVAKVIGSHSLYYNIRPGDYVRIDK